jgi:tRNA(fMet)-specific endonuclease VapC
VRYLLDTNICIYIREKRPAKVLAHFDALSPGDVGMSIITHGELVYGALRHPHADRALSGLSRLAELIPILALPARAGDIYGRLRSALAEKGMPIGPNDLWIAAHALASGLVLVTNNEREFKRIKDLKIENWAK